MRESASQRLFERLVDAEGDRCAGISQKACDAAPANFVRTITANFFTKLGDAIASPKITLAWLMGAVGAPAYLVGLLVPIRESGSLLPQLVISGFIRHLAVRKHVWVAGALLQALAIAGIGLAALFLDGQAAGLAIVLLLVLFSVARGFSSIADKDVLGKTIPKAQRGQTTGWAASAAGMITLAIGVFLILGVGQGGDAVFYAWLVIMSAGLWLAAAAVYVQIKEYEGETSESSGLLRDALGRLSLIRQDAVLRRFVITRSLLLCSALSAPYYISIAQEALGSPAQLLGIFIIASGLASMLSGPFWGRFADRSSRVVMILAAAMAAALGVTVFAVAQFHAAWFQQAWLLPLLYFLLSVAHQGVRVGRKTYVVDIAEGNERTDYVAVSNTAIGVVLLFTGMLGAVVAVISVPLVVLILSLLGIAGVIVGYRLPEA
jgi:hypothetical protein